MGQNGPPELHLAHSFNGLDQNCNISLVVPISLHSDALVSLDMIAVQLVIFKTLFFFIKTCERLYFQFQCTRSFYISNRVADKLYNS